MLFFESFKKGFSYAYSSGLVLKVAAFYFAAASLFLVPLTIGFPLAFARALSVSDFSAFIALLSNALGLFIIYLLLFFTCAFLAYALVDALLMCAAAGFSGSAVSFSDSLAAGVERWPGLIMQKLLVLALVLATEFVFFIGRQTVLFPVADLLRSLAVFLILQALAFSAYFIAVSKKHPLSAMNQSIDAFSKNPLKIVAFQFLLSLFSGAIVLASLLPLLFAFPAAAGSLALSPSSANFLLSAALMGVATAIFLSGIAFAKLFSTGAATDFFSQEIAPAYAQAKKRKPKPR